MQQPATSPQPAATDPATDYMAHIVSYATHHAQYRSESDTQQRLIAAQHCEVIALIMAEALPDGHPQRRAWERIAKRWQLSQQQLRPNRIVPAARTR